MSITLKNVNYIYMPGTPFERQALTDVSFTIEEGSFTALAGHTGSGKSTLLQHFNGLLAPSSGTVLVDGVDINDLSRANKVAAFNMRREVGMVFQYAETQLFEETIAKDIAFGPTQQGLSPEEVAKRVTEAMKLVGLSEELRDRSPFQLSGGQMRRVAIAGILALHPKYLVLDEPTAGLDPKGREELIQLLQKLHKKWKLTLILVSHSMEDIARLADNVLVMNRGKLVLQGSPREVFQQKDILQQAGLKQPRIMQLLTRLKADGYDVTAQALTPDEGLTEILRALKEVQHDAQ